MIVVQKSLPDAVSATSIHNIREYGNVHQLVILVEEGTILWIKQINTQEKLSHPI